MTTISLKVPDELNERLERLAQQRGQSKSEIVRNAIEQLFGNGSAATQTVSALELAGDLVGVCDGPGDLSTNKASMEGFGK